MEWIQFKEAFFKQLDLLNEKQITDEEFFNWYCESIKELGGKLPMRLPDEISPFEMEIKR